MELIPPSNEDELWHLIIQKQNQIFFTCTGLPFTYAVKCGKDGTYNKELVIDRKQNSKTLTWSSIRLAYQKTLMMEGQVIPKPKALGDIRGVSYVYPLL